MVEVGKFVPLAGETLKGAKSAGAALSATSQRGSILEKWSFKTVFCPFPLGCVSTL